MASCCARGYEHFFGAKTARRDAKRYRERGLDDVGQRLVDELAAHGNSGATVLEIGGGVGSLSLELLKREAERATGVEISSGYDDEAEALARENGVEGRVHRLHGDFVELQAGIEPADVVVMHRVVCCYPDPEELVGAAAGHARRLLAMSFPRDVWWLRLGMRLANVWFRLRGGIQAYVHDPDRVVAIAEAAGMRALLHERGSRVWRVALLAREDDLGP